MRAKTAEKWLSGAMDGELSPRRRRRLEKHMAEVGSVEELRRQWAVVGEAMRTHAVPPGQTAEAAWHDIRRALRQDVVTPVGWAGRFVSPWQWALATMAVCVACVGVALVLRRTLPMPGTDVAIMEDPGVEWVETDLPGAAPMVYQDAETGWTVIWVMAPEENDTHVGS